MHQDVILVDENDQVIGKSEKLAAHQQGLCHRAFSVVILRDGPREKEMLLQQRSMSKYHSPGLWSNACCSHPSPENSSLINAAIARLDFEMGIKGCTLSHIGSFHYRQAVGHQLIENEVDHVFVADADPLDMAPNPDEVMATQWLELGQLKIDIDENPQCYTAWLPLLMQYLSIKLREV